jgi:SAM-dependent methyltransferase
MKSAAMSTKRWQDEALKAGLMDDKNPIARVVAGLHDVRWDGLSDLLLRARGRSVLDVGCNRAHTLYDFALNGAKLVHGCDVFGPGMAAAQQWFAEVRDCESKFAAVDLSKGPDVLQQAFANMRYDIVLMIGVLHKLKREMTPEQVSALMQNLGRRTIEYFGWSGYPDELPQLDFDLGACGLKRIHTSEIGGIGHPAAIWKRL